MHSKNIINCIRLLATSGEMLMEKEKTKVLFTGKSMSFYHSFSTTSSTNPDRALKAWLLNGVIALILVI